MESWSSRDLATKMLIAGIVLILVRVYTNWDIWVVIGALLVIKALILYFMPVNNTKKHKRKR